MITFLWVLIVLASMLLVWLFKSLRDVKKEQEKAMQRYLDAMLDQLLQSVLDNAVLAAVQQLHGFDRFYHYSDYEYDKTIMLDEEIGMPVFTTR